MLKTSHEIRRYNLSMLSDECGSRDVLAAKLGRERNQIDQLLAKKNMGPTLARDIEKKIGKPHGWMDQLHINIMAGESPGVYESGSSKPDRKRTELLKIWSVLTPEMRNHLLAIAKSMIKKK